MTRRRGLDEAKGGDLLRKLAESMKTSSAPTATTNHPRAAAPQAPCKPTVEAQLQAALERRPSRFKTPAVTTAMEHPKKHVEVLKVPAGQKEAVIKAAYASVASAGSAEKKNLELTDFGEAAYRRVAALRSRLEVFSAAHSAPGAIDGAVQELIAQRIFLGSNRVSEVVDPDNGYFVGHDFGTSSTKAVLRDPYRAGAAFAVQLPPQWCSGGQPHLWPTALWFEAATGRFSAVPRAGWLCLSGFKSALIEGLGHRNCCGAPVLMAEAAAAFLAMHVAYIVGTALERDPSAKIAGINIGIPVAALTTDIRKAQFEKVVRVGLALVPFADELTAKDVRNLWDSDSTPIPYSIFTELSGAIAGYCTAPRHYRGGHMIIDCGSATLDLASFSLGDPEWPIGIHCARVEPLGADACITYTNSGASEEECRRAARYLEFQVFRESVARGSGFSQDGKKYSYQVLLIGGGVHSNVHKPLFQRMEKAFHRPFHLPELARDLYCDPRTEPGRLILADGLARAPIDLREVAMPGDRPPATPSCIPEMITKDQV